MNTERIEQTIFLQGKPEQIYRCFVDPEKQTEFTKLEATGAGKENGRFIWRGGFIYGKFIRLLKGKQIIAEWKTTSWPKEMPPSIIELDFIPAPGGTSVTLIHSRIPKELVAIIAQNWNQSYWSPLMEYLIELNKPYVIPKYKKFKWKNRQ
jgi:activator of HSP90 ATPase